MPLKSRRGNVSPGRSRSREHSVSSCTPLRRPLSQPSGVMNQWLPPSSKRPVKGWPSRHMDCAPARARAASRQQQIRPPDHSSCLQKVPQRPAAGYRDSDGATGSSDASSGRRRAVSQEATRTLSSASTATRTVSTSGFSGGCVYGGQTGVGAYVFRRVNPNTHTRAQTKSLSRPRDVSPCGLEHRNSPMPHRAGISPRNGHSPAHPRHAHSPAHLVAVPGKPLGGSLGALYEVTRRLSERTQEADVLKSKLTAAEVDKARVEEELLALKRAREEEMERLRIVADKEAVLLRREMEVEELVQERKKEAEARLAEEKKAWMQQMKIEVQKQWEAVEEKCRAKEAEVEQAKKKIEELEKAGPTSPQTARVPKFTERDGCGKSAFFARLCPADKLTVLRFADVNVPPSFTGDRPDEGKTKFFARLPGPVKLEALKKFQVQRRSVGPSQRPKMSVPPPSSKHMIDKKLTAERQQHFEELDDELDELLAAAAAS
eukprot:Hpha_TRINITY_DN15577_c2_g4::TRINITY_DN15577_c2_g4_i1::g.108234::m.108234